MAQHFPIIEWIMEDWYPEMIKELQRIVKTKDYSRCEVMPDEYLLNRQNGVPMDSPIYIHDDYEVLLFKPDEEKFSMLIDNKTEHWNPSKVCNCSFEIHINKKGQIREVFVPL